MSRRTIRRDEYETPPELMLAIILQTLEEVPAGRRGWALGATTEHFKAIYAGLPLPKWVQMLADLADRESRTPAERLDDTHGRCTVDLPAASVA